MSDHARAKAEEKIGLTAKIAGISHEQLSLVGANSESSADPVKDLDTSAPAEASPAQSESTKLRAPLMTALKEHISCTHLTSLKQPKSLA